MDRDSRAETDPSELSTDVALCPICDGHAAGQPCPADRVGQVLAGKYRMLSVIGVGGMGVVFAARHEVVGRRFAVKVLHPALSGQPEYLRRFRDEAAAAGSLENENIAAVTDFGVTGDGGAFLVMEYLDGEDLRARLDREGRVPVGPAVDIAIQACRGLAAAHARGIVHRDLKPENLFLCRRPDGREQVKVLDFGIAKLQAAGTRTQTGITLGTAHYMSPEQARGARDLDQRTDVHAVAAVLYEMISGRHAHPGESYNEVLYHVHTEVPTPLDELCPGLPAGLSQVIQDALAERVDARTPSVHALADALLSFVESDVILPGVADPSRAPSQVAAAGPGGLPGSPANRQHTSSATAAVTTAWSQPVADPPGRGSGRGLRWAGLGGMALVVAVAALWWWQSRPGAQGAQPATTDHASVTSPPTAAPTVVAPSSTVVDGQGDVAASAAASAAATEEPAPAQRKSITFDSAPAAPQAGPVVPKPAARQRKPRPKPRSDPKAARLRAKRTRTEQSMEKESPMVPHPPRQDPAGNPRPAGEDGAHRPSRSRL